MPLGWQMLYPVCVAWCSLTLRCGVNGLCQALITLFKLLWQVLNALLTMKTNHSNIITTIIKLCDMLAYSTVCKTRMSSRARIHHRLSCNDLMKTSSSTNRFNRKRNTPRKRHICHQTFSLQLSLAWEHTMFLYTGSLRRMMSESLSVHCPISISQRACQRPLPTTHTAHQSIDYPVCPATTQSIVAALSYTVNGSYMRLCIGILTKAV